MTGFQKQVNLTPAPAVAGDYASANPHVSVLAGPGGLVAGVGGVTVGTSGGGGNNRRSGPDVRHHDFADLGLLGQTGLNMRSGALVHAADFGVGQSFAFGGSRGLDLSHEAKQVRAQERLISGYVVIHNIGVVATTITIAQP